MGHYSECSISQEPHCIPNYHILFFSLAFLPWWRGFEVPWWPCTTGTKNSPSNCKWVHLRFMFTQWFLNERRDKCVIAGTGVDQSTHFQLEWGLYAVVSIPREPHIGRWQDFFFFYWYFCHGGVASAYHHGHRP